MKIIAHRGFHHNHPPNSMGAFQAAITAGFDGIECDVRRVASGELVIFHDENLKSLGWSYATSQVTYEELTKLAGGADNVPLAITLIEKILPGISINFEIKDQDPSIAPELESAIDPKLRQQVLISSRHRRNLQNTNLQTALIRPLLSPFTVYPKVATRSWKINRSLWRWLIKRGTEVYIYPAETFALRSRAKADGVSGIITDGPPVLE